MSKTRSYILTIFLAIVGYQLDCRGQSIGYSMPDRNTRVEIPFSFQNGFIVVPVMLQGFFPVKFIFDTGAETTIITNPRIAKLLDLRYTRKFEIMGSDMDTLLHAYMIKDVLLSFSEGAAPTQDILVFDRDHFNLEEFIGNNVQGILGADIFRNFTVSIDYHQELLVIYKKGVFKPSNKYINLPMEVAKGKPYIRVDLTINREQKTRTKLLLDTGAGLTLLLDADKEKGLNLPEKTIKGIIGYGIGGELEGYLGRITSFDAGPVHFDNLITNFRIFKNQADSSKTRSLDQKDGIIGNEILKHFKCVFDFPNEQFYLSPFKKNYNKRVEYDRSGLSLIMVGKQLHQIMVSNVLNGSPAAEAGFQKGDMIKSINGIPLALLTYESVVKRFKKLKDKKYKVKINRQGSILTLEIVLRNLI